MKPSVFGEYGEFTEVEFISDYAYSENVRTKQKKKIRNLLPKQHRIVKITISRYLLYLYDCTVPLCFP
jgi:hypothetical protein